MRNDATINKLDSALNAIQEGAFICRPLRDVLFEGYQVLIFSHEYMHLIFQILDYFPQKKFSMIGQWSKMIVPEFVINGDMTSSMFGDVNLVNSTM